MKRPTWIFLLLIPVLALTEPGDEERQAFEATNEFRVKHKKTKLELDTFLCRIAREHSERMARQEVEFGHDGFSNRSEQVRKYYPGSSSRGENVYWASWKADGKDAVTSWINSPGHRENMLNSGYTKVGIGVAYDPQHGTYYTQLFSD